MKRLFVVCMIAGSCALHAESNSGKTELPRVMVVLEEKIDNADAASRKTSLKIESALLAKGYRVIDAKQFDAVRQRDSAMRELNSKKALALARRFGAEILVTGGSQALDGGAREAYGFKSYVYSADGSVKALATETGEVLAVFSAASEKASQTKPAAAWKTLEAVGDSLGMAICASLEKVYAASQDRTIEIVVQGVDDAVVQKIEADLPAAAPGIRRAVVRFMEGDEATYDCLVHGRAEDVRKQLTTAKNFVVTGFEGSRIDIIYRARQVKHASARVSNALSITEFTLSNVFPAQGLHYVKHPLGSATVKNTGSAPIGNITARTFIAGYMREPSEQTIASLQPGEEKQIAVFALLDPEQLALVSQRTAAQLRMELSYESAGEEYSRAIVKPVSILSRHAIAWAEPRSAAGFITPGDEAVESFAHAVLADVQHDPILLPSGSANMMNAVKMWNALQSLSFVYTADAWTGSGADALDEVRYPRETLAMRSGDCDDLSALLASCLESVGVPTALAVTQDHVFVLFDTGVLKKNALHISADEGDYAVRGGTVWLPLETTMKNASFAAAWKEGAKEYRAADAGAKRFDVVETHQAWKDYPPLDLAQADASVPALGVQQVTDRVNADIKTIGQELTSRIAADAAALKHQRTESSLNRAALLLSVAGRYDEAASLLAPFVSPASLNNLGNICLLKGDSAGAVRAYAAALRADQADAGIMLNLGVLNFMGGDEDAAEASMRLGMELLEPKERAYELLGLRQDENLADVTKEADARKKIESKQLKRLLDAALKDVKAKKMKEGDRQRMRRGENKFVFGGRRGLDPTSVMELKDLLYWKKL